jgi:hypothetical protein
VVSGVAGISGATRLRSSARVLAKRGRHIEAKPIQLIERKIAAREHRLGVALAVLQHLDAGDRRAHDPLIAGFQEWRELPERRVGGKICERGAHGVAGVFLVRDRSTADREHRHDRSAQHRDGAEKGGCVPARYRRADDRREAVGDDQRREKHRDDHRPEPRRTCRPAEQFECGQRGDT